MFSKRRVNICLMVDIGLSSMLYHLHMMDLEIKVTDLEKNLYLSFWVKFLEAKHSSGKLRCPATALMYFYSIFNIVNSFSTVKIVYVLSILYKWKKCLQI